MLKSEITLATLPASSEAERVLVVLIQDQSGSSMELRQQSHGDGVGWFTQSTVELEPQQVAEMRMALGHGSQKISPARQSSHKRDCQLSVFRAESA